MQRSYSRSGFFAVAIASLVTTSSCRVTDLAIWGPEGHDGTCAVRQLKGILYYEGPDKDNLRHRLDLFLPKDRKEYPVIVLVHGGAWTMGDNRCCGLYSSVGEFFAGRGIGVVLPNYRLSPTVKHPEHVKDVARAVAWTHRHVAEYGGNPEQLFLVGHSAGGHLVALVATDEKYLKAEGMNLHCIRGVVGVSGVYEIPSGNVAATLGGSFRLDEGFPVRSVNSKAGEGPGIPLKVNVYGAAFGDDAKVRADASPVNHVHAGLPPFLLVNAENDLPTLPAMTDVFRRALRAHGCPVHAMIVPGRNHNSIFFCAMQSSDPVAKAIEEFVRHFAR